MGKIAWDKITREDVIKAIQVFERDNPEYPESRSTFLLFNKKKLPAKHIRGMAYKEAFGTEISKNDYAGGMETVRFFRKLGFDVFYKGEILYGIHSSPLQTGNCQKNHPMASCKMLHLRTV